MLYVINHVSNTSHSQNSSLYIYIYIFITRSFLIQHKVQSLVNFPQPYTVRQVVVVDSKSTLNQSLQPATERSCFWLVIELQHARYHLKITLPRVVISTRLTIAKSHMNHRNRMQLFRIGIELQHTP